MVNQFKLFSFFHTNSIFKMKTITFYVSLWFLLATLGQNIYAQTTVSDDGELRNLVNAASPGSVFIIPNGTYRDFEGRFSDAKGAPGNPITIKAETVGGVTLTKESLFSFKRCEYIVLEGFVFDGEGENTLVKLEGSNNIRITRNVFELKTTKPIKWVFIGGIYNDYTFQYTSHHNRIDHNIFKNKETPGHYITIDGTSNQDRSDSRQSQYDRIDHNYFKNNSPRAKNEKESIRIGWSQMSMSSGFTTVEHNLFEDCDGDPEIVSVKSSDNTIRHNTFRSSYGTLSLRHGNRTRVEGNYFFGGNKPNGNFEGSTIHTGGIRIYGTDHVIVNNYMEGLKGTRWDAPIALTQGDAIDGSSSNLTKHFRAERVTIAYNTLVNNTYGIEIGFDNNNNYNKKLKDITIANNLVTGSQNNLVRYIDGNDQGGEVDWFNNVMHPTGSANLVTGGPGFSTSEVMNTNPNLSFDGSVWQSTSTTPKLNSAVSALGIDQDIEGQSRPSNSTVGADHFSTASVRYKPLTPSDVGPNAGGGDVDPPSDFIVLSTITDFGAEAGTKSVTVSSNVTWSASDNQDWISISPNNGSNNGTLEVTVTQNTGSIDRTGILSVTGAGITRTLTITQKATVQQQDKLTVSLANLSFDDISGSKNVSVSSNIDWTISSDKNWISVSPSSGSNDKTITVTVTQNTSTNNRAGILTITGGAITRTIDIAQSGMTTTPGNDTLLNVLGVVASSSQTGNGPENTLDKDFNTRWSSQGIGETITYDLGDLYDISSMKIAFFKGDQRTTSFDISVSEDGTNYNTVLLDQISSGSSNNLENFAFATQARYVRIVGKGNSSGNNWNSLTEVEIYGSEIAGPTITETTLSPAIDSYIRGGSFGDTNYNSSTDLWVKQPGGSNTTYRRIALFNFNISELQGTVTSAKLILTPVRVGSTASDLTTEVYECQDFDANVTYNQAPELIALLDTKTGGFSQSNAVEYDVTTLLEKKVSQGLDNASIAIKSDGGDASRTYVRFASKEYANDSYRPKLLVTIDVSGVTNNTVIPEVVQEPEVSVPVLEETNSITMYPLPARDVLYMNGLSGKYTKVMIVDMKGRLVKEFTVNEKNQNNAIDIGDLKNGMYLLKMTGTEASIITKKIIIK